MIKNPHANAGDTRDRGLIPGLGRSPKIGNGNPLQYSCLGNRMERGAWWATVHRVAKSWTCQATEHTHKTEESRLIYGQDTLGVGQYIPRPGSKSATSYVNLGESLNLP